LFYEIFIDMKKIIKKLLREHILKSPFKGRNIYYHITNLENAINMIETNKIDGNSPQEITTKFNKKTPIFGISFSRDSEIKWRGGVQLILNGDLIKQDYGKKIMPFDFIKGAYPKSHPIRNTDWSAGIPKVFRKNEKGDYYDYTDKHDFDNEPDYNYYLATTAPLSEEFLIGDLEPLSKYLLGVRLYNIEDAIIHKSTKNDEYVRFFKLIKNVPFFNKDFERLNIDNFINNKTSISDTIINLFNKTGKMKSRDIIVASKEPDFIDKLISNDINKLPIQDELLYLLAYSPETEKILNALNQKNLKSFLFAMNDYGGAGLKHFIRDMVPPNKQDELLIKIKFYLDKYNKKG